jgi:hypothetical protein
MQGLRMWWCVWFEPPFKTLKWITHVTVKRWVGSSIAILSLQHLGHMYFKKIGFWEASDSYVEHNIIQSLNFQHFFIRLNDKMIFNSSLALCVKHRCIWESTMRKQTSVRHRSLQCQRASWINYFHHSILMVAEIILSRSLRQRKKLWLKTWIPLSQCMTLLCLAVNNSGARWAWVTRFELIVNRLNQSFRKLSPWLYKDKSACVHSTIQQNFVRAFGACYELNSARAGFNLGSERRG